MLLNRNITAILLLLLSGCSSDHVVARDVCPQQNNQPLRYVDIFDGPTQDMAILMPDVAQETHGYWLLGYVYDAKRRVNVRCKYANGQNVDVELTDRVERCSYKIDKKKNLTLFCK
jgi:hypothetical protein